MLGGDHFFAIARQRFTLDDFLCLSPPSSPPDNDPQPFLSLAEDYMRLIMILLTDRSRVGHADTSLREHVIHW